jgi:hypothetical protein
MKIDISKISAYLSVFQKAASPETSYYPDYSPDRYGKLHGHCGCVSYALQKLIGGRIVSGTIKGQAHFWNELDNYMYDLCTEQFDTSHFYVCEGKASPIHTRSRLVPNRKNINPRFQLFWDRVQTSLH